MNDSIASTTGTPLVRRSLCCECGNLRTVKSGYAPREYQSTGESPARIRECMQFAPAYWSRVKPYERFLEDLKCPVCARVTRHAIVDDQRRRGFQDSAEEENLAVANAWATVQAIIEDFAALGVRVEEGSREFVARLVQYLDDGVWFLDFATDVPPVKLTRALETLYDEMLSPETRWFVVSPDPTDERSVAYRGLAFRKEWHPGDRSAR